MFLHSNTDYLIKTTTLSVKTTTMSNYSWFNLKQTIEKNNFKGYQKIVARIVKHGEDLHQILNESCKNRHLISYAKTVEMYSKLIEDGAQVQNYLWLFFDNLDLLTLLMANADVKQHLRKTATYSFMEDFSYQKMLFLFENGMEINPERLFIETKHWNLNIARFVVEVCNFRNPKIWAPVMFRSDIDIAKYLINAGIDLSAINELRNCPGSASISNNENIADWYDISLERLQLFLENGLRPDIMADGRILVHSIMYEGHDICEKIKLFIEHGLTCDEDHLSEIIYQLLYFSGDKYHADNPYNDILKQDIINTFDLLFQYIPINPNDRVPYIRAFFDLECIEYTRDYWKLQYLLDNGADPYLEYDHPDFPQKTAFDCAKVLKDEHPEAWLIMQDSDSK